MACPEGIALKADGRIAPLLLACAFIWLGWGARQPDSAICMLLSCGAAVRGVPDGN